MNRSLVIVFGLSLSLFAMEDNNRQLLLCPKRKTTIQSQAPQSSEVCVFCDSTVLAKNYIVSEDKTRDCRIMMNKFPYFDFSQGYHVLIMPITHRLSFNDFSSMELAGQIDTARFISARLYPDSYTQEYFTNLGEGWQSVPHVHSHIQSFIVPPLPLSDTVNLKKSLTNTIDDAFTLVKEKLSTGNFTIPERVNLCDHDECYCCSIIKNTDDDDKNFVIGRFKHNLICLAHFPRVAAEVVIVPYNHGHSLHHLNSEELLENMKLAFLLLPILKSYVQENVRQWKGNNIFTKSIGGKASQKDKEMYHLYTSVMSRTIILGNSGTIDGNSCKLDFDPTDLFNYLKKHCHDLQSEMPH